MKQFMKRLAGFSIGPVLGAILSIIQTTVLTRVMIEGAYGQSGLFRSLLLNIPTFLYLGLDQAYTREYHAASNKRQLMQQAAFIPMLIAVGLSIVSIVFAPVISNWLFDSPAYPQVIWLSAIWILATVVERFFMLAIRMEEKAREFSGYTLLLKVNVFVLSLILVAFGVRDFQSAVYGLLIGQLLGDAVLFYKYRMYFDLHDFKPNRSFIQQMLTFGVPVMLAAALTSILSTISNVFVKTYHPGVALDVYNGTVDITNILGILKTSFASFWVPTAYRWFDEQKSMKHFKFISEALLFVLTFFFFGLLLFKWVFVWVLGARYQESLYIIGLLSFPHIMYTLSETTTLGIVFSRRTHFNIVVGILALVPSVVLNVWLTPILSYKGAAIASCMAYIVFYLARTYFSKCSGFYFSQHKTLWSIALMTLAAGINAFDVPYVTLWTLLIGLVTLFVQFSTVKDAISIRQQGAEWDFT